jgi:protein HIRA/HIR1
MFIFCLVSSFSPSSPPTPTTYSMDVCDLAWAPDDSLLASCSIDNFVLIWRIPALNNAATSSSSSSGGAGGFAAGNSVILGPERRLSGHSSWVKGLAWDPMGTFLASASDDRSVVVWRTSDWQVYNKFYVCVHAF